MYTRLIEGLVAMRDNNKWNREEFKRLEKVITELCNEDMERFGERKIKNKRNG